MPLTRKPFFWFLLVVCVYLVVLGSAWLRAPMSEQEFGYTAGRLAFINQDIRENGFHWWEPNFLGGQHNISVLSYLTGLLPYALFAGPFDLITAFKIGTLLCMLLGALAAYALGRDISSNSWAGFTCGLAYLLASEIGIRAALVEHSMMIAAMPLVPLAFWAVVRLAKSGSWFDSLLLAASFSGALLCYTKIGTTLAISLGIFWIAWFVKFPEYRSHLLRGAVLAGMASVILGLLPLLPLLREFSFMTIFETVPFAGWQRAFSMKSGTMWLDRGGEVFTGLASYLNVEQGGYYLGIVGLIAIVIVIFGTWRRAPARHPLLLPLRIFLGNALVMSWLSYGPRSVFTGHFEWLRFSPNVADPLIAVHWLMLGAQGLLIWWLLPPSRHRLYFFIVAFAIYLFVPVFRLVELLPGFNHLRAPDSFWILAGTLNWAIASGLAVVWCLRQMPTPSWRTAAAALVFATALLDNVPYSAHFFRGGLPSGTIESFSRAAETIKSSKIAGRVLPISGRYFYLYLPHLTGRGLSTESGHHNFMLRRRAQLEATANTAPYRLLTFLNVAGVSHVFIDKKDMDSSDYMSLFTRFLRKVYDDKFFAVFENPSSLAPAFLASKTEAVDDNATGIEKSLELADEGILGLTSPPDELAKPQPLLDSSRDSAFQPILNWGSARRGPDKFEISLKNADGWVVFEDAWHPDWRALLDGKPAPIFLGLDAFPAVRVAPGNRSLTFEFHPPFWYSASCLASLAGWIFTLGFLAIGVPFQKSRTASLPVGRLSGLTRGKVSRPLVVIPTYNEADNLPAILDAIRKLPQNVSVLVVDDGSPDGTAALVKNQPDFGKFVHLIERASKSGLGSAYKEGFRWAATHDFDAVIEMDGDFSHNPNDVPALLATLNSGADAAIGSRYLHGVRVLNWPQSRLLLSTGATWYVRLFTGLPLTDATSGFKALRVSALDKLDWRQFRAEGYGFQVELHFWLWQNGAVLREVPVTFTERHGGTTKMTLGIAIEAATRVLQLAGHVLLHPNTTDSSEAS